jgi:uncharacterized protein with PIN domain
MPSDADQPECFVFDACALIAYLNDEPGADKVEDLLEQARRDRVHLYVASVNVCEVFYDCFRRDAITAGQLVDGIYGLPITVIESLDRPLMHAAWQNAVLLAQMILCWPSPASVIRVP